MAYQPPHTPIDQLVENSRIKGASRCIPDGTAPDSVNDEMANQVAQSVLEYIGLCGMSRSSVARSIGVSPTVIGLVLNLNYRGNQNQVLIDLDKWLEQQLRQDAAPKQSDFIWTKLATEIKTIANVASMLKTIGLVYGPDSSGYGKTMALQALAAEMPGAVLVTVEKVNTNASGLIGSIAHALRISPGSTKFTWGRIKAQLAGSSRLLIFDQVHALCGSHPSDKGFYVLTDLFDATGSPQLWCGTANIISYLQRGQASGKEPLAQIRRRIGVVRDLSERARGGDDGPGDPLYTQEEIRQVFGRAQMRMSPGAIDYLWKLANSPGSGALGACSNLVRMTIAINEKTAQVITSDMLRAAHSLLISQSAFSFIEQNMERSARVRAG